MKKIKIFDTTLRDGRQAINFDMTEEQEIYIFDMISKLEVDTIEFGMANIANEKELNYLVSNPILLNSNIQACLLSRLVESDIRVAIEVLNKFKNKRIEILGVGSEIHLNKKLCISEDDLYNLYSKSIEQIKSTFDGEISFILEDASRASKGFLLRQIEFLISHGVKTISIADTVGCMTPSQVKKLFSKIKHDFGDAITLSAHFHNDLGLATANSLVAIESGVDEIQCTCGGIGERCGNSSLEEIIGLLQLKPEISKNYYVTPELKNSLDNLNKIFKYLDKEIDPYKPLVGKYAFSTAAGIHQDGILKSPETYAYFDPSRIGRSLDFVINKLSSSKLKQQLECIK